MLVGAKHLEDKLSVIAKNSSPNASPVQLSVVRCQWGKERKIGNFGVAELGYDIYLLAIAKN
ncbi:MAG: hypothetical protein HEP80_12425 [Dolichospermum sp. UKL201]|nr:MAG: hypothetical protein HEP80_12425 [Dolichospermum sp. UKL201]